ncbi:MAG: radical SAM protein [Anaerolineae bacterium]|nr:radical SAM protein [Anaerolineae bacterium]
MKLSKPWTTFITQARELASRRDVPWAPIRTPSPGLHTYPISLNGGQRRVHLRVHEDGSGVLFIDVTEVIHLNATAVHMVKLALDGVPMADAEKALQRQYRGVSRSELQQGLARMYEIVRELQESNGCPTCAMAPELEFRPVFSTPVTAPYKADIALTYACNNACPHCYNEPDRFAMAPLSHDDWFRVLDKLHAIGIPHLILTGGEPTLLPLLPTLVRRANRLGHIVGMNTNGRRLSNPDLVNSLVAAGLNHIQVTLASCYPAVHDAMVGTEGAFRETVDGIQNALAAGLHTITNTTLTKQNQDHALDIIQFVHDLGLTTFAMNGMIYAGGGTHTPDAIPAEEMKALLAAVRDKAEALGMRFLWYTVTDYCQLSPVALGLDPKRCNAAEYSICIEPNGDVLPCQSYYVSAGNILTDPWETIWNSALFRSFRERETDPEAAGLPKACWDCPDLEMCGGGCRLEREARARGVRPAEQGCARARLRASGQRASIRAPRGVIEQAPTPVGPSD